MRSVISDPEFDSRRALALLGEGDRQSVAALAEQVHSTCQPMDRDKLVARLTALGMVMSPNRPPAEASMWVRETARLLSDIAADILCDAIDTMQKRLKFLPTVAEIRELADPPMERRRKEFARLDAMRRYLESGQPIGTLVRLEAPRNLMDRRGEEMSEAECEELNAILGKLGAVTRYRPDGSRYDVGPMPKREQTFDRPQMPTRQDYINMGVDPAVLDTIEAEKQQQKAAS